MATKISDYTNKAPFEDEYGVTGDQYRPLDDVLGKTIYIIAAKAFDNEKGPGAFILCRDGKELFYLTTHSVGLVATATNPSVLKALETDEIEATLVKRKSKTSDRLVYCFE